MLPHCTDSCCFRHQLSEHQAVCLANKSCAELLLDLPIQLLFLHKKQSSTRVFLLVLPFPVMNLRLVLALPCCPQ
ncbi:MAG TPA: hypothetical protein DF774_07555 [Rheinheimera sp.]|nr:hypothetical protein [Rheinheimera sp.]